MANYLISIKPMNIKTVSIYIMEVLKGNRKWHFGGNLEQKVHSMSIHKSSTVSRIARMMAEEGLIEVDYQRIKGVGRKYVVYRYKTNG